VLAPCWILQHANVADDFDVIYLRLTNQKRMSFFKNPQSVCIVGTIFHLPFSDP
jgi:hypothetical protein